MPTKAEIAAQNAAKENLTSDAESHKQVSQTFDETAIKKKIQTIEENVNKIVGRKGYNPHFWLNQSVHPLVNRFLAGERTSELQDAILALPDSPPKLDINLGMTEDEQRKKYAELQREQAASPIGLMMPKH